MRINRRSVVGILAGAAAGPVLAQAPSSPAPGQPAKGAAADAELRSAREDLISAAQRIAQVQLPRTVEPAFRFRT